ncbi:extracellular solute-binding protein [Mycobacteroides chelonae]|uniref:Sugar ABC transporter substrate-binding protein n=1 Tax=Mycobacteroides chelonae TaxID=1774 RepID=A0A1S1M3U6_MYCCH|nr:extracellular solute-binding protein [Mycobacteroides chelonae]OHU77518.1 sugar ABC transporter substrate-binding protein [Mycobacteroides chelonae]QQG87327.1 extracellular solute-binding protein [Mycobacteroides chelonae]QQG92142.1 extracellular solute-binding protein [Mycobacteroides chelonae]
MKSSTRAALVLGLVTLLLFGIAVWLGIPKTAHGKTVVTVRVWDEQVAKAYRSSFDEFSRRNPDIEVAVTVTSYASYFNSLRTDVAGHGADDIFWLSNAYLSDYADTANLTPIEPQEDWDPSVVAQFTRSGKLWGAPQLSDAGIALYYNKNLLDEAQVDPAELAELRWDADPAVDTLRPMLHRLTGPGHWAYNAANDLQGIYLNYLGSAGAVFQKDDRFAFANPLAEMAFTYLVDLINVDKVAPSAADTNANNDFSRNQFLQGRMALFQSGTYNLAQIQANATFPWGVAMMPAGPQGRVSVTNGIVAAANSSSPHPEATKRVLAWMGSADGNSFLGRSGSAIPAVLTAREPYFQHWAGKGVDVAPFFQVLEGQQIAAPGGQGFGAGFAALKPYFAEMFLGRLDVHTALQQAQQAANKALEK